MSTYYATKSYVTSLTSAINEELREAKSRVHICMLCPGPVNTNFNNVANVTFALPGISATVVPSFIIRVGTIVTLPRNKIGRASCRERVC